MTEFIQNNWISIIGSLIGLIYVYLEYKANIWMWLASIAMAGFYIFIFYRTHLYASMVIYAYFLLASIYGWLMWLKKAKSEDANERNITHMPKRNIVYLGMLTTLMTVLIYSGLTHFSENQGLITFGDAASTALNIIALWMVTHKWVEQWLPLIVANIISSLLFFSQHDLLSSILFAVFCIVSIFGYFKWKYMANTQTS